MSKPFARKAIATALVLAAFALCGHVHQTASSPSNVQAATLTPPVKAAPTSAKLTYMVPLQAVILTPPGALPLEGGEGAPRQDGIKANFKLVAKNPVILAGLVKDGQLDPKYSAINDSNNGDLMARAFCGTKTDSSGRIVHDRGRDRVTVLEHTETGVKGIEYYSVGDIAMANIQSEQGKVTIVAVPTSNGPSAKEYNLKPMAGVAPTVSNPDFAAMNEYDIGNLQMTPFSLDPMFNLQVFYGSQIAYETCYLLVDAFQSGKFDKDKAAKQAELIANRDQRGLSGLRRLHRPDLK